MSAWPSQIRHVTRGVLLELWRRQDVWILLLLMGVFAGVAGTARLAGAVTPAAGTFMLNLGMSLAGILALVLTVLVASRQFPDEIDQRTLYPLLAKPLGRATLVMGKWWVCTLAGWCVYGLFFLLAWLAAPHLEPCDAGTLAQHLVLQPLSIAWAAALAIAASLVLPRGLALVGAMALVFVGEPLYQWGVARCAVAQLLPRFGALDLATRYTDGVGALATSQWLALVSYGVLWTMACLLVAQQCFRRRSL